MTTVKDKLTPLAQLLGDKGADTYKKLTSFLTDAEATAKETGLTAKEKQEVSTKDEAVEEDVQLTEEEIADLEDLALFVAEVVGEVTQPLVDALNERDQALVAEAKEKDELVSRIDALEARLSKLDKTTKELNDQAPRHVLKKRASASQETVVDEKEVKDQIIGDSDAIDPISAFIGNNLFGGQ